MPPKLYGGIERIVASLIVGLRQSGHEVGLVGHPESSVPNDYFAAWEDFELKFATSHAKNMRRLMKASSEFCPDIVHSFSRLLYLLPLLPRSINKVMSYQRWVGGPQIKIAALLGKESLIFTGCSSFIANMGRRSGGQWRAIPNFVDTKFYTLSGNVGYDAPLLFLSRIERIKGAHTAIEIAKRAGRRLIIAGNHAEAGPDRDYFDANVKSQAGRNGIEYVGPVDDEAKRELLRSCCALIVPIEWDEPFGIVFVEALACGTPVISCPRGAVPEIVRHGVDGFLINSVEEGCRAVSKIMEIDRRECSARVASAFSKDIVIPLYESLYHNQSQNAGSTREPRR